MDKVKYSVTCYVPGNACNFRCNYCYISNCVDDKHMDKGEYKYPLETMIEAFNPKRNGGNIYEMVVIGSGETLISDKVVPFIHGMLKFGHVVSIVTNCSLNNRIDELLDFPKEYLERLIVKGSLHWKELKRLNKIDDFFNNIKKIIAAGASAYPSLVISDDYKDCLDEIRDKCLKELNDLPHCTPGMVFNEKTDIGRGGGSENIT